MDPLLYPINLNGMVDPLLNLYQTPSEQTENEDQEASAKGAKPSKQVTGEKVDNASAALLKTNGSAERMAGSTVTIHDVNASTTSSTNYDEVNKKLNSVSFAQPKQEKGKPYRQFAKDYRPSSAPIEPTILLKTEMGIAGAVSYPLHLIEDGIGAACSTKVGAPVCTAVGVVVDGIKKVIPEVVREKVSHTVDKAGIAIVKHARNQGGSPEEATKLAKDVGSIAMFGGVGGGSYAACRLLAKNASKVLVPVPLGSDSAKETAIIAASNKPVVDFANAHIAATMADPVDKIALTAQAKDIMALWNRGPVAPVKAKTTTILTGTGTSTTNTTTSTPAQLPGFDVASVINTVRTPGHNIALPYPTFDAVLKEATTAGTRNLALDVKGLLPGLSSDTRIDSLAVVRVNGTSVVGGANLTTDSVTQMLVDGAQQAKMAHAKEFTFREAIASRSHKSRLTMQVEEDLGIDISQIKMQHYDRKLAQGTTEVSREYKVSVSDIEKAQARVTARPTLEKILKESTYEDASMVTGHLQAHCFGRGLTFAQMESTQVSNLVGISYETRGATPTYKALTSHVNISSNELNGLVDASRAAIAGTERVQINVHVIIPESEIHRLNILRKEAQRIDEFYKFDIVSRDASLTNDVKGVHVKFGFVK